MQEKFSYLKFIPDCFERKVKVKWFKVPNVKWIFVKKILEGQINDLKLPNVSKKTAEKMAEIVADVITPDQLDKMKNDADAIKKLYKKLEKNSITQKEMADLERLIKSSVQDAQKLFDKAKTKDKSLPWDKVKSAAENKLNKKLELIKKHKKN